jgi:hypothetical protein
MSWTYQQSTGQLSQNGLLIAKGYSGFGKFKNDPAAQHRISLGPIPQGKYIIGPLRTSKNTGPFVMDLTPVGHNALGRSAFQIHGDNQTGTASHGCIILDRPTRLRIGRSKDAELIVIA